ncbi:hypothetical protein KY362_07605, partial [Candidatus Woesearchaeota archaeon]|nr:hypothetical protein [Candidatus Woesearchaeota archaeon]
MKLEEIIGFRQAVEEIVPKGSPQYETICAAFDRLSEVAYQPGHGITLIIKLTEDHYRFER